MKNKNQKGITLVALVITIIVLLILAGVAINMAINSDGLFGKANEATEKWNESVKKEETAIGDLFTHLDEISPTSVGISTNLPDGWEPSKIQAVATAGNRQVPIPVGYTVSYIKGENTISQGLVIYEGTEAVTDADENDNGIIDAQENRNQYVWIPVDDINDMIMCKLNNANNDGTVCNLILDNNELRCKTHNATGVNTTDLCGRLYITDSTTTTIDGNVIYKTNMNFEETKQIWGETSYREPAALEDATDADGNTDYLTLLNITGDGEKTALHVFEEQLDNDFNEMAKSVAKYKGFYVARYEAGYENIDGAEKFGISKKNTTVITNYTSDIDDVVKGVNMWYGLYAKLNSNVNSTLKSYMVWGSQYDQIIKFIGDEAQVGHVDRQLGTQNKTGYVGDKDIMKNIYDLEGNNREWTVSASSNNWRVSRGGFYYRVGVYQPPSYHPAFEKDFNKPNISKVSSRFFTSRATLYLEY